MESTAQYWRPVWEALEQHWRPGAGRATARRGSGHAPSRTSAVESRSRRAQEGLSRCGTFGETPGRAGTHLELCARRRATALAHRDAPQVPDHAQPRATPQPAGVAPRGSPHQGIQCRVRSAGHQRPSHAARARATAKPIRPRSPTLAAPRLRATPTNCATPSARAPTLHPVYRRLLKLTLEELR